MSDRRTSTTLRLPPEEAADIEAVARVEGLSVNELVRQTLAEKVAARRADPDFQKRVRDIMDENKRLFERLAAT